MRSNKISSSQVSYEGGFRPRLNLKLIILECTRQISALPSLTHHKSDQAIRDERATKRRTERKAVDEGNFRMSFYSPTTTPIAISAGDEDTFVRRGYYGGHADVYKTKGENFYYYDVNSLYPYVMKTYPMPIGPPIWSPDLHKYNIEAAGCSTKLLRFM